MTLMLLETMAERHWKRAAEAGQTFNGTACLRLPNKPDPRGYVQLGHSNGKVWAHRLIFEHRIGPIPVGLTIDHLCRNRWCVNPLHMEAVSQKENVLRGQSLSALNARKTHCRHGHEFTAQNTYTHAGERKCRECRRASNRKRKRMEAK